MQLRLEDDGMIYVSDKRESRKYGEDELLVACVSFGVFADEWRKFVNRMIAREKEEIDER
jgi:hypothetical protein